MLDSSHSNNAIRRLICFDSDEILKWRADKINFNIKLKCILTDIEGSLFCSNKQHSAMT